MTLNTIFKHCSDLPVSETRISTDICRIVVVRNDALPEWKAVLISLLGHPIKTDGDLPDKEQLALTKNYGGIYSDQTLFVKELAPGNNLLAMFWPWQQEPLTTVKLYLIADIRHHSIYTDKLC